MVYSRYLQYQKDPADAVASGGMYAFGDTILGFAIFILFLIPTAVLLFMVRNEERFLCMYSKILLAVSLTAPLSLAVLLVDSLLKSEFLSGPTVTRLFLFPCVLIVMILSLLIAKPKAAKKLLLWGVTTELCSSAIAITALFLHSPKAG